MFNKISLSLSFVFFLIATSTFSFATVKEPKVVFVMLDGVRALEIHGQAKDDFGKPVKATDLFPNLFALQKSGGIFFPEMKISNPAGISLPAYSDIFVGRRQEKIINNHPADSDLHSHYPTMFEVIKKQLGLSSDQVAIISAWDPLCKMAVTSETNLQDDFFRDCGWQKNVGNFKPEVYEASRTDMDNFMHFMKEMPKRHPRLTFVHFGDGDEEAHLQKTVMKKSGLNYGIYNYHKALKEEDYYISRMWTMLQSDPYYKDSTYLIVATDHGRDNVPDSKQWADHGECIKQGEKKLCSGCQHVFTMVIGPSLSPKVVTKNYSHIDIAPTIAKIFGVSMPTALGQPMAEVFSGVVTKRMAKKK